MDSSAGPNPSQPTSSQNKPRIFIDSSGNPIDIYLQSGGIEDKTRLSKTLKNHGANISYNPEDGTILLVDAATDPGRKIIREWGKSKERVILQYTWIAKCLDTGRALLLEANWGGYLAVDDGKPINTERSDDDDDDMDAGEVRPARSSIRSDRPVKVKVEPSKLRQDLSAPQVEPGSHRSTPHATAPSVSQPPMPSQNQPMGPPQYPPFTQSMQMPPQIQFPQGQPMQFPQGQQMPPMDAMFTLWMMMQTQMPNPQQMLVANQPQGMGMSTFPSMGAQVNNQMMASMMDMMRHQMDQNGNALVNGQAQQFPASASTPVSSRSRDESAELPPNTPSEAGTSRSSAKKRSLSPSLRRTSSSKDKDRAGSSSQRSKAARHSISNTPPPRSAPVPSESPKTVGSIFRSRSGRPLVFAVHLDLHSRFPLVTSIKKNGGKIVTDAKEADYVIVPTKLSLKTSSKLVTDAIENHKRLLRRAFVDDSISQGALVHTSGYSIDLPTGAAKRAQVKTVKLPKVMSTPEKKIVGKQKKQQRELERVQRKLARQRGADDDRLPSPSPPPEESRAVPDASGKYRYTPEERAFIKDYMAVLVAREPRTSITRVGECIFTKLPHHSLYSIHSLLGRGPHRLGDDLERMREEARVAAKERPGATSQLQAAPDDGDEHISAAEPEDANSSNGGTPEVPTANINPAFVDEDLDVICNWFANGGAQDRTDDQVWVALAEHAPCRAAGSWPQFYLPLQARIKARLEEMTGAEVE